MTDMQKDGVGNRAVSLKVLKKSELPQMILNLVLGIFFVWVPKLHHVSKCQGAKSGPKIVLFLDSPALVGSIVFKGDIQVLSYCSLSLSLNK